MMKKRKLGIIGGSGLYKMEGFEKTKWKKINTPWGKPSDEILLASIGKEEICFIPRHARGHKINPTNINFRANIDAMKQLGVTDIISVSAVGSLKENLEPGKFVIVDQFIDRTFSRIKTYFDEEIVAHVSMAKPTSPGLSKCCEAALKKLNVQEVWDASHIVIMSKSSSKIAWVNPSILCGYITKNFKKNNPQKKCLRPVKIPQPLVRLYRGVEVEEFVPRPYHRR